MARKCEVTGKKPMVGNNVSHANNKTKRRFLPNLQYRRFWVESENRWVRLRVTSAALRLIDKKGIDAVLADMRARGQASTLIMSLKSRKSGSIFCGLASPVVSKIKVSVGIAALRRSMPGRKL